jgi:hypothetical protein
VPITTSGVPAVLALNMYLANLPVSSDWLLADIFTASLEFEWLSGSSKCTMAHFVVCFVIDTMCPFKTH